MSLEQVKVDELVNNYLEQRDWRVRENANRIYGYGGLKAYVAESVIARYALTKVYGSEVLRAHVSGDVHIHDLGHLTAYCCGYGVEKIVMEGLRISGIVSARPPKHMSSYVGQVLNFIFGAQQDQAGAVAINRMLEYAAGFAKYDKLEYKQIKQIWQEFVYSLNMPLRAGLESPFVNITIDTVMPDDMSRQAVVIGGEMQTITYGVVGDVHRLVCKALLEVMSEGDAVGRPFTFPIITINVTRRMSWDDELGEMLAEVTAKYGLPYFQNMIGSDLRPDDVLAMCCHLQIDRAKVAAKYGGIFGKPNATGSIGVVTINLPRIGWLSRGDDYKYIELLEERLRIARICLNRRRQFVEGQMRIGLYPFLGWYLGNVGFRWHFNTVSVVGMHESLLNMGIEDGICSGDGVRFAERVLKYVLDRITEFEEEDDVLWNFEQAPAESASRRLKVCDMRQFGKDMPAITIMGEELPYTNSTHVPVNYTDDVWWVLKHQERLNKYYTGGSVVHIWLGESLDVEVVPKLVMRICKKTSLPYFSITPTYSICEKCGYIEGEHWECPRCGNNCEVYSRIVGYYKPVQRWNDAKQAEFKARKMFKLS